MIAQFDLDQLWHTMAANRDALLVAPLVGAMCSLLSVYIVLRRMSLIAEGVSHAGFGGIAVAILIGHFVPAMDLPHLLPNGTRVGSPFWWQLITGLFCLGTALLIGYVTRRKRVSEDAAIGILLVTAVAFGALLIRITANLPHVPGTPAPPNVETLLFGDFISVTRTDLYMAIGTTVIVFGVIAAFYYQFLYTALDEEMARVNGVRTRLVNALQLMLISLVIVVCGRAAGFFMITALTIIPGATANMLSRRFSGVMILSLLIGTLGTTAATGAAMIPPLDRYPPGPLVVLVLFVIFAIVWTIRNFIKPRAAPEDAAPAHDPAHEKTPGSFGHGHSH